MASHKHFPVRWTAPETLVSRQFNKARFVANLDEISAIFGHWESSCGRSWKGRWILKLELNLKFPYHRWDNETVVTQVIDNHAHLTRPTTLNIPGILTWNINLKIKCGLWCSNVGRSIRMKDPQLPKFARLWKCFSNLRKISPKNRFMYSSNKSSKTVERLKSFDVFPCILPSEEVNFHFTSMNFPTAWCSSSPKCAWWWCPS